MIEYAIEDKDGNQFSLNDIGTVQPVKGSLTYSEDSYEYDTNTVPNSFLPGAVKIGSTRLMERGITFSLSRAEEDDASFRSAINLLLSKLNDIKYLVDITNDKRILVVLSDFTSAYDKGSLHHSSEDSFSLTCLNPYWEDYTLLSQLESTVAGETSLIAFDNDGFLELAPIFEFTVSELCTSVSILIESQSLIVEDDIFGTTGNEIMSIDNDEGNIVINNLDRTEQLVSGLGFITIPVGSGTIEVKTSVDSDLDIQYRRRYYV